MKKTNETGASMIEVLGVFAIISMISVGLYSGIASIRSKITLQQQQTQISDIVKGMREQFSSFQPSSNGVLSASKLYEIGILNARDVNGDNAHHLFGSSMYISNNAGSSVLDPYFEITLSAGTMPPSICIDLLTADWGNDPSSGLMKIKAIASEFVWKKDEPNCSSSSAPSMYCLPPTIEEAYKACKDLNGDSFLSWSYYY